MTCELGSLMDNLHCHETGLECPQDGRCKHWLEMENSRLRTRPKSYEGVGREIGQLVDEKQAAYGDSFGKAGAFLKLLWPEGVQPDQYNDLLTVVRVFDKLMRVATAKDAFGESPYRDIAGYGILAAKREG